jgi:hypothetical protein
MTTILNVYRLQHRIDQLRQEYERMKAQGDPRWQDKRVEYLNAQARLYEARKGDR